MTLGQGICNSPKSSYISRPTRAPVTRLFLMPPSPSTFRSLLWNHLGKILEFLLVYVSSVLVARIIGVQENGKLAALVSISQLLLAFSSLGLETSLNRFVPRLPGDSGQAVRYLLGRLLRVRLMLFGVVAAIWIGVSQLSQGTIFPALEGYGLLLLFYAVTRSVIPLFGMALTARMDTALNARISLVVRGVEVVAIIVAGLLSPTLHTVLIIFICSGFLHIVLYRWMADPLFVGEETATSVKPLLLFGGILWINVILDYVLGRQGDIALLSALTPDPAQASFYDVASALVRMVSLSTTIGFSGVSLAAFSRLSTLETGRLDSFYASLLRGVSLLTIPLLGFVLFHAHPIVCFLYSPRYEATVPLIQGLIIFRLLARLFGTSENAEYLLSIGNARAIAVIGVCGAAVNIAGDVLLIPRWGAFGAVLATGVANVLVNGVSAWLVLRKSRASLQWDCWVKLCVGSCVGSWLSGLAIPQEDLLSLSGRVALYLIVLAGTLWIAKPLTAADAERAAGLHPRLGSLLRLVAHKEAG